MSTPRSLRVEQIVPAPIDAVFEAWLDPSLLKQWMTPAPGISVPDVVTNPVVGGAFRIVMRDGTRDIVHEGEYIAIDRPTMLAFTWNSEPAGRTMVTVRFESVDAERTRVVLTHERLVTDSARDAHIGGWQRILDALSTVLDARRRPSDR